MPAIAVPSISREELEIVEKGNIGGLSKYIFLCRADAVSVDPVVTSPSVTVDPASDFTFVDDTTEVFSKVYHTKDTGKFEAVAQGEFDSKSYKQSVSFAIPTLYSANMQLARNLLNENVIAVVKDRNGQLIQVGTKDSPAVIEEVTASSGGPATEARNIMYKITADSILPAIILEAEPQTTPTV
ncbi:hypothetical protein [Flammeovirga pacifica]|uniref:Uncharacterized protein n=1 Tax=Flammeovirga pacifica TaxID=915059 RepID=A0A1S1Z2N8_FLAPC|nr:hypothetical protein [Flammeovirga pacifica]OHX67365.1 hypothetical protein NH26_13940 [Flammeovirga pacifica]